MSEPANDTAPLERLFEQSSDPVFIVDPTEDRIVDANSAGCRMLEYTREELLMTPISRIHPAELPRLEAFFETARSEGANWTIAMTCRTKSGRFLPTETALFLLDSGTRVYVIGLVRDRSEHRT
jgi:two-component system, chemotaxis family, sensor kinase Cph1